jgi:FkbM family methyltransferase
MAVLRQIGTAWQRGPLAPLYPPAKRMALSALRMKEGAAAAFARAIRLCLRLLPISVQANLKYAFAPVRRLDYAPRTIRLHVDSAGALYRTHACRKEPETVRWIEKYVRPGDVLYDVGANVGAYSLIASKHCGGNVRVHAFEPSFATYDELCRNVVLNGCEASVFPHQICLAETSGLVAFVHASLEPGSALHQVEDRDGTAANGTAYRQEMLGFSVDFLVTQFGFPVPNHVKIDVDGTELKVLRGAARTLDSDRVRTIQVEVSPRDPSAAQVTALLEAKAFRLASETPRGGDDRWSNRLFVRAEMRDRVE